MTTTPSTSSYVLRTDSAVHRAIAAGVALVIGAHISPRQAAKVVLSDPALADCLMREPLAHCIKWEVGL